MSFEYWRICVEEILGDHGVSATSDQIESMAKDFESCARVQGEYSAPIADPVYAELAEVKKALQAERSKVVCVKCQGSGILTAAISSSHCSTSQCWRCNGVGRV